MRAASLLLVFVLAKLAVLWGHVPAPLTGWWLDAYFWQDVAAALAFGAIDIGLRKLRVSPHFAWALYGILAFYTAVNIPVGRVVATPLTRPMLLAARGPLADSILLYATRVNIVLVLSSLATAAILPLLLRAFQSRPGQNWPQVCALACAIVIIALGPAASARADTRGMERNVITALIDRGLPHYAGLPATSEWREVRFDTIGRVPEDLSRYSATAGGLNVVMISLESTAAQYLSLYGDEHDTTPNLNSLAQHALVFDNAYAVYPESIKGLFSVLCSTFPAFDSQPEAYESVTCRSLAAVLADAGYRTAMFHSGRFSYLGMESIVRNRGYQTLEDAAEISGNYNSSFGVDEPATVSRMLAWIDALPRGQRFFLNYLPIAGHHPYATPGRGPFKGSADIDQYRNALHYGDESLGTLRDGLRARGLESSTIWVIYGDHGEAFGQHPGNYGHTFFLYEENIHVPLLIAAPGLIPVEERERKVVSLVDIAPTVLDLLGMPAPSDYQGRTMLDKAQRMAPFFADYSLGLLGLRDGRWKYIYEPGSGRTKLFDLEHDPEEKSDLSPHESARTAWYGKTVRGWANAQETYIARGIR